MATAREIHDRLTPKHLTSDSTVPEIPSEESLKQRVGAISVPEDPPEEEDANDPRGQKEYTFQLDYRDGRGKAWRGRFKNRILSIHDRQQVGVLRSMLAGGQPVASMDALTIEINLIVAHLTYSLIERPEWAANLRALEDPGLLQAIYTEVDSHESFFLGWGTAQKNSEGKAD